MSSTRRLSLFHQHSRHSRENKYVYPVISRRSRGLSIGINLNPDTICNFDCVYCCVDRSVPPVTREVDLDVLDEELERMLDLAATARLYDEAPLNETPADLRRLNDVAFSGDGEPTSYPRFGEACERVANRLSARGLEDVKIVVITNATLLQRPGVVSAMEFLDHHNGEIWAKLDAGTEDYYRKVERTSIPLARVLENVLFAGRSRDVVIQSLFMTLQNVAPPESEIDAYVGRLRDLKAAGCRMKLIQLYTVARRTAENYVGPLDDDRLGAIAGRVRELGFNVSVNGA